MRWFQKILVATKLSGLMLTMGKVKVADPKEPLFGILRPPTGVGIQFATCSTQLPREPLWVWCQLPVVMVWGL